MLKRSRRILFEEFDVLTNWLTVPNIIVRVPWLDTQFFCTANCIQLQALLQTLYIAASIKDVINYPSLWIICIMTLPERCMQVMPLRVSLASSFTKEGSLCSISLASSLLIKGKDQNAKENISSIRYDNRWSIMYCCKKSSIFALFKFSGSREVPLQIITLVLFLNSNPRAVHI